MKTSLRSRLAFAVLTAALLFFNEARPARAGAATAWAPGVIQESRTAAAQSWAAHTSSNVLFFVQPEARPSFFELPRKPADPNRVALPGLLSRRAAEPYTVHQLFPHDGAVIPLHGRVTFGWLPMDDAIFKTFPAGSPRAPRVYELIITHEDRSLFLRQFFVRPQTRQYTALFQPPRPGRYQWRIRALADSRLSDLHSEIRYFTVLPR